MKKVLYSFVFGLLLMGCDSSSNSTDDTPEPTVPSLFTTEVTLITHDSANSGGRELNDNGSAIAQKGVCWSIQPAIPTIDDPHTSDGSGTPHFMSVISGLTPNTQYFVRSYAINDRGIGYGEKIPFTTTYEPGSPPCTPTNNSVVFNSATQNFSSTTAGTMDLLYGFYGLIGSNAESNLHIEFKEAPITGVYMTVDAGAVISDDNCVISGTFGDGFGEDYVSSTDELVYVVQNGDNLYSITFCGVELFSTDSDLTFTTDGNLTAQ